MINIPDTIMTTDGYTPHKFINGFVEHWEDLRDEWPAASLFKEEGHIKPRKHNQRPHLRMFMCYSFFDKSIIFIKFKL